MSTTTTLRLAGVDVPITLDARQWSLLACLISVHSRRPIMSPFDTEALGAIGIELERQLETRCREEAEVGPSDAEEEELGTALEGATAASQRALQEALSAGLSLEKAERQEERAFHAHMADALWGSGEEVEL